MPKELSWYNWKDVDFSSIHKLSIYVFYVTECPFAMFCALFLLNQSGQWLYYDHSLLSAICLKAPVLYEYLSHVFSSRFVRGVDNFHE